MMHNSSNKRSGTAFFGSIFGWAVAEKLVCVRIWRMYNCILITRKWAQEKGFLRRVLGGLLVLVGSPGVMSG